MHSIRMENPSQQDEIIKFDITGGDKIGSGKQFYKCKECNASYKSKMGLYYHTISKHEGISYSCKYCGYKTSYKTHLKRHQESFHEGVKYSCDKCDYHAKRHDSLKAHKKSFQHQIICCGNTHKFLDVRNG